MRMGSGYEQRVDASILRRYACRNLSINSDTRYVFIVRKLKN